MIFRLKIENTFQEMRESNLPDLFLTHQSRLLLPGKSASDRFLISGPLVDLEQNIEFLNNDVRIFLVVEILNDILSLIPDNLMTHLFMQHLVNLICTLVGHLGLNMHLEKVSYCGLELGLDKPELLVDLVS